MDALALTQLRLLSLSQNLLQLVQAQRWDEFAPANALFQQALIDAKARYGDQMDEISAQLLMDNQKLMQEVVQAQQGLFEQHQVQTNNVKKLKAYQI